MDEKVKEIEKCPFCESADNSITTIEEKTFIECWNCEARGPLVNNDENPKSADRLALGKWQQRSYLSKISTLESKIKELEEGIKEIINWSAIFHPTRNKLKALLKKGE